ncbi:MAG: hypothetical protein HYY93_01285 [Planctomycetes bacterium]|nr:hypothetical protein [Planctomycetota bacterium]
MPPPDDDVGRLVVTLRENPLGPQGTTAEEVEVSRLWEWRNRLHAARTRLTAGADVAIAGEVDELIGTAARLGRLLEENANAVSDIAAYRRAGTGRADIALTPAAPPCDDPEESEVSAMTS